MAQAKGSTLIATMDFVKTEKGADILEAVMNRITEADREAIETCSPTAEMPLDLLLTLWRATDDELRDTDPQWVERAGGHSIEVTGVRLYGGILRKASPMEFLNQRISLFRLYYHPGDMELIEEHDGYAVTRLVGFDQADPLFCRRQTGGLRRALREAGGEEPDTSHVRCVNEGDAFCEWELRWR
jgi:hypothetical protein